MKTLLDAAVAADILSRLTRVHPDAQRQWGKMDAHQMVCHLCDSFRLSMGERTASPATGILQRTVLKTIALRVPLAWPKGVPTRPEMDPQLGGTPPSTFATDQSALIAAFNRFTNAQRDFQFGVHPIFGMMSEWEWMRWAYLHTDHHLRQFAI